MCSTLSPSTEPSGPGHISRLEALVWGVQRVPLAFTELDGGDLSLGAANVASNTQRGFRP